jgi:hypothetical protein
MNTLQKSISQKLFDAISAATHTSTAYALPAVATQITWQTIFDSAPSSITVLIETSLDNITWSTADTSTATAGAIRTFNSSAVFVRARISAISAGGATQVTVIIVAKPGAIVSLDPTFNSLIVLGQIHAGSLVLDTPYNPFDQSLNKADHVTFAGLTYPISDGINGQVIGTDGSGHLSFIDQSGGGGGGLPLKNSNGDDVVSLDGNDNVQLIGYDGSHNAQNIVGFGTIGEVILGQLPSPELFQAAVVVNDNSDTSLNQYGLIVHQNGGTAINPIALNAIGEITSFDGAASAVGVSAIARAAYSGTVTGSIAAVNAIAAANAGIIDGIYGIAVSLSKGASGTIATEAVGLDIGDVNFAGISNFAIRTQSGLVSFGDSVISAGTVTATDFIMSGSDLKSDTTDGHKGGISVYDVDGAAYLRFLEWTNSNTPTVTLGPPTGGTLEVKASVFKSSDGSSGVTTSVVIPAVATLTIKNGLITGVA